MRIQKWVIAAAVASCGWAQAPIDRKSAGPAAIPDSVSMEANIPYGEFKETVLDILQPKEPAKKKRPGVILIHGGGWTGGTKEARVEYAALKYAQHGFVVANVEYRLAKAATAPAAVSDVLKAAQWFHKNAKKYHVDAKRIVVTGDSAGGHLAMLAAYSMGDRQLPPSCDAPAVPIKAVVNFYGPVDLVLGYDDSGSLAFAQDALRQFIGGSPAEFPER